MLKIFLRYFTLFSFGALAYGLIEIAARGYTHISMGILGGITMIFISLLNDLRRRGFKTLMAVFAAALFITLCEFVSGLILNIAMQLNIWDYSQVPFNFMGQICLPFVFIWAGLSYVALVVEDLMRVYLFKVDNILPLVQK